MTNDNRLTAEFPEKLVFLFYPHRYKVAKGGRWSGKSWSFARALLILGYQNPLRILCGREIQNSIKDSVHKLLSDQIQALGLGAFYDVLDTTIRGRNGTEIMFTGLQGHTVDSLKSYEGIDICWIEEGQSISDRSWTILTPTIRKDGSEIWISMNPDLETDPTYQRFVVNPPDDCVVVTINWRDNPWFSQLGDKERLHCLKTNPEGYPNIWEGECRPAVEGAIYYKEVQLAITEGRICRVPYDPMLRVHIVMDLGWNDSTSIILLQKHASELRCIRHIEDSHRTLADYSADLKALKLNWGRMWLPHDAYSGDLKTGKTVADIMRKLGWDVPRREEITELSVEDGIRQARMMFHRWVFDKAGTERLIESLKRYRRHVNKQTNEAGAPLHDEYSHGADVFRYACVNADQMINETYYEPMPFVAAYRPRDVAVGL